MPVGSTLLRQRTAAIMQTPPDYPPDALSRKAREVALGRKFGEDVTIGG